MYYKPQILAICLTLALLTGCAKNTMHAGAINQADSDTYSALLIIQSGLDATEEAACNTNPAVAGCVPTLILTHDTATALNKAVDSFNAAVLSYKTFKAGTSSDLTAVQQMITAATADLAAFESLTGKVVK